MLNRTCIALASFVAATVAFLPLSRPATAADEPLLVIVGASFSVNDVSLSVLKDAFRGRASTVAGKKVIPISHPLETPLRVAFDRVILGLEPAAVGRFWVDRRIRAEGNPPTTASTPELAVRIVASLPNSISYAHKSMLNPKVKAVTVDGKAATDPGYALKH